MTDEIAKHILHTVNRIEDKLDKHMREEDERLNAQENKLLKVERDLRWHSKIAGGVGAAIAVFIGYFHRL